MPKKKTSKNKIPKGRPSVEAFEKMWEERKMTVAEKLAETSWDDIVKLTTSDEDMATLIKIVSTLRQGMIKRIAMFERKGIFSYAVDASKKMNIKGKPAREIYKEAMKGPGTVGYKKARARNTLIAEYAKYQQFFMSYTASIEGVNYVNAVQDERIFEEEYQTKTMTDDERKTFWHAYEDFMESPQFIRTASMTSESVQQHLASAMFSDADLKLEKLVKDTVVDENGLTSYFDEYGIEMTFLDYEKNTKLRSMYEAYYKMQREEHEAQIGRAERGENEFNIFSGGRNY